MFGSGINRTPYINCIDLQRVVISSAIVARIRQHALATMLTGTVPVYIFGKPVIRTA
jgi:hypothetical protein